MQLISSNSNTSCDNWNNDCGNITNKGNFYTNLLDH